MAKETAHDVLKRVGATMLRNKRHEIWQLPNKRIVVLSKTSSDFRSNRNTISDIMKAMRANS